jgi:hypothetical protein
MLETTALAPFTIAKMQNQPGCPSMDELIKLRWYTYIMEYYLAIKKNEMLSFMVTWMKLEDIMLSEISQVQKDKFCMFSLTYGS